MFKIRIAGLFIAIDNKYPFTEQLCRDYITTEPQTDFCVCAREDEMTAEKAASEAGLGVSLTPDYVESVCVYREICLRLPAYDAFLLHSATVSVDGRAYAFCAKSGTGKSTHIALWYKLLGDRVKIINGDKPVIRFENGIPVAYGTPWCGKEFWGKNTSAPLHAVCFIERSAENRIAELPLPQAASRLMNQVLMPRDEQGASDTLGLLDRLLSSVSVYVLGCNISTDAAKLAFETMSGIGKE